jgi:hypothetical protein
MPGPKGCWKVTNVSRHNQLARALEGYGVNPPPIYGMAFAIYSWYRSQASSCCQFRCSKSNMAFARVKLQSNPWAFLAGSLVSSAQSHMIAIPLWTFRDSVALFRSMGQMATHLPTKYLSLGPPAVSQQVVSFSAYSISTYSLRLPSNHWSA